jgi:putative phosphoribosyl transferase
MVGGQTYRDRTHAGDLLAEKLAAFEGRDGVVVLGLARGGLPVAARVACRLHAPLDVFVVRKVGVPGQEELAMGAVATGGVRVLNEDVVGALRLPQAVVDSVSNRKQQEIAERERRYRGDRPKISLTDRTVLLVDDGLATGSSMLAAIAAVRQQSPREVIVAVPVGAQPVCDALGEKADQVICGRTPEPFRAVGLWYEDFAQISDDEVRGAPPPPPPAPAPGAMKAGVMGPGRRSTASPSSRECKKCASRRVKWTWRARFRCPPALQASSSSRTAAGVGARAPVIASSRRR